MSFLLTPEEYFKDLELQMKNLKEQRQGLAEAQAKACSRGQCGGADEEAGAVPYQHEIKALDNQILELKAKEDVAKSEIKIKQDREKEQEKKNWKLKKLEKRD